MDLPDGFSNRAATTADIGAVVELINTVERLDIGETMIAVADVEADWASPSIDIDADTVVIVDDAGGGRLAGAGQVDDGRADVDVHPEYRQRGLGSALLGWSERRAAEQATAGGAPPASVGQTIASTAADALELLRANGYERSWDSWVLRLPERAELPAVVPDGVTVRPYRPDEERIAYEIIETAFSEWEGRTAQSFEAWQSMVTERPDFDPALLLVATAGDEPVGAAFGVNYPSEGWVDKIAVLPDYRGRGIAKAMLATLFAEFRSRGETYLGLTTDSRTGALDLYLHLGMVVQHTYTRWTKQLTP